MTHKFWIGSTDATSDPYTTSKLGGITTLVYWQVDNCSPQIIAIANGRSISESKYRAKQIVDLLEKAQLSMIEPFITDLTKKD